MDWLLHPLRGVAKGSKRSKGQRGQIALGGFLRLLKALLESLLAFSTLSTFWTS